MPNFTPRPDRSLVRRLTTVDEQLASVFNQSWQAITDNLQLIANVAAELTQQTAAIDVNVTALENSYNTQLASLQSAQSAASPVLATSNQRNSEVNSINNNFNTANNKTAVANVALTAAETNLNAVAVEAQPYNVLLNAIAQLTRPNNSMLGTNASGTLGWLVASGQSFTLEMGYVSLRRSASTDGGSIAPGNFVTVPLNTKGFMNARNQWGLVETDLSNNAVILPCTGGNCRYYFWGLSTVCGVGSANTRARTDSTIVSGGSSVQSISGRSSASEDFNQFSTIFSAFNVGASQVELRLDAIAQNSHPNVAGAALGRGLDAGSADFASILLLRRRIL